MNNNTRLIELDFFRGVALLIIFWDHLHWFTEIGFPLHYGFSDAAAVFVFLSGYVSGIVYWKTYNLKGMRGVVIKAFKRAVQIYVVHIIAVAILLWLAIIIPNTNVQNPVHIFFNEFTKDPYNISLGIIFLQYFPDLFDILPLYIILVSTIPLIIWLIVKDWRICFWLFFILYCATQVTPMLNLQHYYPSWTFNPLSWVFLFAAAMIISINNRQKIIIIKAKPVYISLAFIVLTYSFLDLKTINQLLNKTGILPANLMFMFPSPFPLIEKSTLEPVSLLHFFCLAYIVSTWTDNLRILFKNKYAYPLVVCGQHSLALFSIGIILTYLFGYLIAALETSQFVYYLFALTGWAFTLTLGVFLAKNKKQKRQAGNKLNLDRIADKKEGEFKRKELKKIQAS